ncbi:MAG: phosphatidate cytidylyltransferase [Acidobacteriia bacterium]|nr:phosphatidate cytidylyltransferase [Terriglobia bacterium]
MTWKRILTAAVLIPLVVALVLRGSTAAVTLAIALVTLLALFEYFALGEAIGHRAYRFWTATCALVLLYLQWLATVTSAYELAGGLTLRRALGRFFLGLLAVHDAFFLFVAGLAVITLFTRRPLVEGLPAAGISSSALLLVAFPLSFTVRLQAVPSVGPWLLLFALVITWVGDTAAYFVGRAFGRHALAPHLSPKKTWEGAVASMAGSLLVALVFTRWINIVPAQLCAMAAVGNVAGQTGDLLESAYKRSAGVKDSGSLLPGHGGILDRIDALILAIPVVWYYWSLFISPGK